MKTILLAMFDSWPDVAISLKKVKFLELPKILFSTLVTIVQILHGINWRKAEPRHDYMRKKDMKISVKIRVKGLNFAQSLLAEDKLHKKFKTKKKCLCVDFNFQNFCQKKTKIIDSLFTAFFVNLSNKTENLFFC